MKKLYITGGLLVLAILGIHLLSPSQVIACTAPPGGLPPFDLESHAQKSDVIFLGRVITTDPPGSSYYYSAEVEVATYLKGDGGDTVTIGPFGTSALCLQEVYASNTFIFFGYDNALEEEEFTAAYSSLVSVIAPTQENIDFIDAIVNPVPPEELNQTIFLPIALKTETDEPSISLLGWLSKRNENLRDP